MTSQTFVNSLTEHESDFNKHSTTALQVLDSPIYSSIVVTKSLIYLAIITSTTTGCSTSNQTPSPVPTIEKKVELDISFVAWKLKSGEGGNCKSGIDAADFLKEGASVRVYDNSNGKLLVEGELVLSDDDAYRCSYTLFDLEVPEVESYRTVIDGRHTDISSQVDLKVRAQEFSASLGFQFATLYLVDEFGVPRY